jgi:thiol-disulfide isomerase/thioredoxin
MALQLDDPQRKLIAAGLGGLAVALFAAGTYAALVPASPPQPLAPPVAAPRPAAPARSVLPTQGALVPAFELERLLGGTVTLASLRGKVVVIDFWATWCPPCRAEMPWLVAMAQRLEASGVAFVAISEDDPPGQVPNVTRFAQQVPGLERFAVLGDPAIEAQYGVTSLPTLFVVDRQGRLVAKLVGAGDERAVVGLVEQVAARP